MAERITEAELRRFEQEPQDAVERFLRVARDHEPPQSEVERLVAEVRRLRKLIVAAYPDFPPSINEAVGMPAAAGAIAAEAFAIREEQG